MDEGRLYERLRSLGLSSPQSSLKARSFLTLADRFHTDAASGTLHYWFVPGRIEFLGKHTDYGGGRSLVCAIERGFCVASVLRDDSVVRITDAVRCETIEFNISADLVPAAGHWSNYAETVSSRIARNFPGKLRGANISFASDLPPSSGLSSSSALIISVFSVLAWANELEERDEYKLNIITREDLAGYLGTVENGQTFGSLIGNRGVGTFGGSQDHTAILCCRPETLSQYSFCPVRLENEIPFPEDHVFVVAVSGVSADKTGNALEKYNRIALLARELLDIWNRATGRSDTTLMAAASSSVDAIERMNKVIDRSSTYFAREDLHSRFRQFVVECFEIIPAVAQEIDSGRIDVIGPLIDRSQTEAEELLGNQVPETIALARLARELGARAASAFGAGFGGSVWAMLRTRDAEDFTVEWADRYRKQFPKRADRSTFFITRPGPSTLDFAD